MTWLDFLILGVITVSTYWSFRQGLLLELSFFVGTVLGLLVAFVFYPLFTPFFESILQSEIVGMTVSFALVFIVSGVLITVFGLFTQNFIEATKLESIDQFLGGVVGFVKAIVGVCVIIVILSGIQSKNPPSYLENSLFSKPLIRVTTSTMNKAPIVFHSFMEDYGNPAIQWLRKVRPERPEKEE